MLRGPRTVGVLLLAAGLASLGQVASAPGADAHGAGSLLAVRSADDGRPVAVLTNGGTRPCRVAAGALGSVTVATASQGGTAIPPTTAELGFADEPHERIASTLRVLDAGQSAELRLPVVPRGTTTYLLSARLSTAGGSTAWLYALDPGRDVGLALRYELPVTPPDGGPPACGPATASGTVDLPERDGTGTRPWLLVAVVAGAGLGVAGGAAVLVLRTRRRRRVTAALTALLAVVVLDGTAGVPDAAATITITPGHGDAYFACAKAFAAPGGDPAGILGVLNGNGVQVTVLPPELQPDGADTWAANFGNGEIWVAWNPAPNVSHGPADPNNPCAALYHEFFHAHEFAKGTFDDRECVTAAGPSGIDVGEVNASRAEDLFRVAIGLPANGHYGADPLPSGPCLPPPPPPPTCTGSCGSSYADPHLDTFDGRHYSFQGAGEFVAARDRRGGFEVQVRQQAASGLRFATRNTAVAVRLGRGRFEVHQQADSVAVLAPGCGSRSGRPPRTAAGSRGCSATSTAGRRTTCACGTARRWDRRGRSTTTCTRGSPTAGAWPRRRRCSPTHPAPTPARSPTARCRTGCPHRSTSRPGPPPRRSAARTASSTRWRWRTAASTSRSPATRTTRRRR